MHSKKKTKMKTSILNSLAVGLLAVSPQLMADDFAWNTMLNLTSDYGNRFAGSDEERKAASWLKGEFEQLGYKVNTHEFEFNLRKKPLTSLNLEAFKQGKINKTIIIGAHYDSIGHNAGSTGFTDNASGIATLLAVAKAFQNITPHYSVKFIAFGAEEVGLNGSKAYVKTINPADIHGMINLDTVAGGDHLYIHSAHSKPYHCGGENSKYSHDTWLRDALLNKSKNIKLARGYDLHPKTPEYPEGETGAWSDHSPFSCLGIPIAYVEATNFSIDGESGKDGYSQTSHPDYWTCFDNSNMASCDRKKEKHWGKIWHTQFDQATQLIPRLESHIKLQVQSNVTLLTRFLSEPK
ncbi:M28 family metallopeptidase [Parashewanella tropica]|uniref:M28 family metallopeptidase n=1 Tax=Parashewanella tropica TaxID=2547970 RepID=UPI00105A1B7A|nr:M20/M25/M40 family metallo-hydrolase [Parashewanella tropica]